MCVCVCSVNVCVCVVNRVKCQRRSCVRELGNANILYCLITKHVCALYTAGMAGGFGLHSSVLLLWKKTQYPAHEQQLSPALL